MVKKYTPLEHKEFKGWYVCPLYPYFLVNKNGVLKNAKTGYETIGSPDDRGYYRACIWDNEKNVKKDVKVHVVVCYTFKGPPPSDNHEVGHKDHVRSNNKPSNLEWVTRAENMRIANERRSNRNKSN